MILSIQYRIIVLLLLFSGFTQAHQQKESYTTVLFNNRSGNLEVSHRFYIHDAEHAMIQLFGNKADILLNAETQKQFANYVQQQFFLKKGNGKLLKLQTVGHEVEGKYFWVYQEMPIPKQVKLLNINMHALQEIWPQQSNQINIEKAGKTRSVRIHKGDNWKSVSLP